jgi:hypothetical protein
MTRIDNPEFILTTVIALVFAVCFAHLEYSYIKEREAQPVIGNMYMYHLFPMLGIKEVH